MGKVCSKAHGLRYVDDDSFIGTRLGPEGECRGSLDSISKADGDSEFKVKTGDCIGNDKCIMEWTKDAKESISDVVYDVSKIANKNPAMFDDCNLIVELPPEGDKADECPPREDHVLTAPENEGPRPSVTNQVTEENKVCNEVSKAKSQDEWSYTVYDIDGGSKVTDQDLSHVMHSIKTAIGESSDHKSCANAKDNKILKIKVAVGQNEKNQVKCETKRHQEFSRMILPPPDSEEAEMLCYYIREKLLTYANNQEDASNQDVCHERRREKRRNRGGCSSGLSSQSPEVACEVDSKKPSSRKGCNDSVVVNETSFTTEPKMKTNLSRKGCSVESHQTDITRPLYGLPQRQDTYGGPVDNVSDHCTVMSRKRSGCSPSSGTRSPQDTCVASRGWPLQYPNGTGNQRCSSDTSSRVSSFLHKDAYRESRKNESPRRCKKLSRREHLTNPKNETVLGSFKPLNSPRNGTQEHRTESSKICPCKYRVRRTSKNKRVRGGTSTEDSVLIDSIQKDTGLCDDTLTIDDVFSRDEVISSDGTTSRDDFGHKFENRSRKGSRSSAESRSDDGSTSYADCKSRERPSQSSADTVLYNGVRWREGSKSCDDPIRVDDTKHKDGNRQNGSSSTDGTRSRDGSKSLDGCKSRDSCKSRDTCKSYDGPRSRDDGALETSSGTSTEVSHSSSWKDQPAFSGHYYSTVHEWNNEQEMSTDKMIKNMQNQAMHDCCGHQSPHSNDSNIGSPKSEIVHRHEHHHYHYHIFKRS